MEELLALFRFLVPYFGSAPDSEIEQALALAAPYRPTCLTTTQQDEAQVYYAAWLMWRRSLQLQAAGSTPIPFGVRSEREGDVSRTYGQADGTSSSVDPLGFWNAYADLAARCTGGAITVGNRGGSCCPLLPGCC